MRSIAPHLPRPAPAAPTWQFDVVSALIGAVIALLLIGLIYRYRDALRRTREGLVAPLHRLSHWLQASAEDVYRERVTTLARSLVAPANVAALEAVFVEPELLISTPPPQSTSESMPGIDTLSDGPQVLPLRRILGGHPQLAILGTPGSGRTTLLAYIALACARAAEGGTKPKVIRGLDRERLPLYVMLPAMDWGEPGHEVGEDIDAEEAEATEGEQDTGIEEAEAAKADEIAQQDTEGLENEQAERDSTAEKQGVIKPTSAGIDELISAALAAVEGNRAMRKVLRQCLEAGQAIVLVDGWDELWPEKRRHATAWLSEMISIVPGNLWLASAGPRGYAPLTEANFVPLKLATWDTTQVEPFARQWMEVYTPPGTDGKQSPMALRRLTAVLRDAARGGASSLELALQAFVYLSDGQIPAKRAALFEHSFDLLLGDGEEEELWLQEACRAALEKIALNLQRGERTTASREEIDAAIELALPLDEERPARVATQVFRALTGRQGLLRPVGADRYTFHHPLWQAFLAARQLTISDPASLVERLDDPQWAEVLRFYAGVSDIGPLVAAWLRRPDDVFRMRLRTLSSWIKEAPEDASWRDGAMAGLARSFLQSRYPARIRQELAEALAETRMPGIAYLFKQALQHPDAGVRRAAVMGLTKTAGDSDLPALEAALTDKDPAVQEAAVRGLAYLGTDAATRLLARLLVDGDETLSLVAAEALARCGAEGADLLHQTLELEDMMSRRAGVYGLARIGARPLLEKAAREDDQWIVRSAAVAALDELEEQEKTSGVAPPLEIDQLPWLISWAAARGEGVGLGDAALHMLRRALTEGDAPTRAAAARALAQVGRPDDVEPLRTALATTDRQVIDAVLEALAQISERHALSIEFN